MKFTLTMFPDRHAILSTDHDIDPYEAEQIQAVWNEWKATEEGMLIVSGVAIQHAETVEIDLPLHKNHTLESYHRDCPECVDTKVELIR